MGYALVVPDQRSIVLSEPFTYAVPAEIDAGVVPGQRVRIPFGARTVVGYVMRRSAGPGAIESPRPIAGVLDEPPLLLEHHVALAHWIADRYVAPLGEVIKAMIPRGIRSSLPGGRRRPAPRAGSAALEAARAPGPAEEPPSLSEGQHAAAAPLLEAIAAGVHRRVLLHGVTGSGKTEVYLAALREAIGRGRQGIVLVPEIALTPQMIRRFATRFPGRLAVVHSGLTDAERAVEWRRIRAGDADVVIGSRSAVFAPLERVGLIVIDEEDSSAYKQDRVPRYHAVDAALELGRLLATPVVLGSATPRVASFYAAHTGGLELASLPLRITGRPLPPIDVVDLREELRSGNRSAMSAAVVEALADCHATGGQSILFLNRRGTATVVVCRSCGEALTCTNCSVSLVYHHGRRSCDCHYCGLMTPLPTRCSACDAPSMTGLGTGTERLEAEVRDRFPHLRLLRLDRDTTSSRDAYFQIYDAFRRREADCLIGTQMVAKGWDLGSVRLVAIINADSSLHFPDYRSGEVTFSLITQVAGRAGRGDEPARVVLQTYTPGHYAVRHAITHDYINFARDEIRVRRQFQFPPYARLAVCTVSHRDDVEAEAEARSAAGELRSSLAAMEGVSVLGPSPAFVHRLRGEYRRQVTIKGTGIERAFPHLPRGRGWSIDVDPV